MQSIEIRCRSLLAPQSEPELPVVALDILDHDITAAELIRRTVEEQIRELLVSYRLDAAQAQRALNRLYLTEQEIQAQAAAGTIRCAPSRLSPAVPPQIDSASEVSKALRAFEKGAYLLVVDGRRVQRLDERLTFRPGCRVTFLRLTPLIGG
jgi:hypothetical protein